MVRGSVYPVGDEDLESGEAQYVSPGLWCKGRGGRVFQVSGKEKGRCVTGY